MNLKIVELGRGTQDGSFCYVFALIDWVSSMCESVACRHLDRSTRRGVMLDQSLRIFFSRPPGFHSGPAESPRADAIFREQPAR